MSNANRVNEYLKARGVNDALLKAIICEGPAMPNEFIPFSANGIDYAIHHFLDDSDIAGYGLIQTNAILNLNDNNSVAIALVEGDDVVCINTDNGSVYLWLIQMGHGERIQLANSFDEFLQLSTRQGAAN